MPLTAPTLVTYTEVVPLKRFAFNQLADFTTNVKPYQVSMTVEFDPGPQGVGMVLTLDAMHDEYWTKMAVMGWESQLDKLARLLKG
jgi:Activator of Hsp90 ATPase homolog 1-like protein